MAKKARNGEPTIYDGQHTSELHARSKTGPAVTAIVVVTGKGADGRWLRHHPRIETVLKGRESESRKGAEESERIPDKPLLGRVNRPPDSRGTPPSIR